MKALPIQVHTSKHGLSDMDCTNGGVSGRHHTLLLIHELGHIDIDCTEDNLVELTTRMGHPIIVPHYKPKNVVGPMFGGNSADGDSVFTKIVEKAIGRGFYGTVKIHDRFETVEQYRSYSL